MLPISLRVFGCSSASPCLLVPPHLSRAMVCHPSSWLLPGTWPAASLAHLQPSVKLASLREGLGCALEEQEGLDRSGLDCQAEVQRCAVVWLYTAPGLPIEGNLWLCRCDVAPISEPESLYRRHKKERDIKICLFLFLANLDSLLTVALEALWEKCPFLVCPET